LKDKPQHESSDFFVGARLAARRQKAGIPIDKAAKDTRIPVSRLRAIESDDFSSFPHPTYARMFLTDYANYLGVPVDEIRSYLPGGKNLGTTENSYLDVLLAKPGFLQGDQFKSIRRLLLATGILIGLVLFVIVSIYAWRTWKKFERVKPSQPPVVATPPSAPSPTPRSTPALILPTSAPTPRGDSFSVMPTPQPAATPLASPTPLTTLPPFEPAPRPKRPQ
jgi:cytoskeleton protein RodZ